VKIALDVMGGDFAPENPLVAAAEYIHHPQKEAELVLVGDTEIIKKGLQRHGINPSAVEIVHASEKIDMHESPAIAIRKKKNSSISLGVDLVKNNKADAFVSAGNTGAMVAASTLKLRTLEGIDRPAIAIAFPTTRNIGVLLDVGANSECEPSNFLQFAIMGRAYASHILGIENPSVGLMSIGEESSKGSEIIKKSHQLMKESNINFKGNVEGNNLFDGLVDVIVCDGFTGNVIIKTAESQMKALETFMRDEVKKSLKAMLGAWLIKPVLKNLKKKADYEEYGGAPLLGIKGVCIISHGRSSPKALKNAIRVAAEFVQLGVNDYIIKETGKNEILVKSSEPNNEKPIKSASV